ncbi:MAG: hypothetical protein PHV59_03800 [Victivallales bacterium]|nr:hypothetical protein [Victivallales bacterium]
MFNFHKTVDLTPESAKVAERNSILAAACDADETRRLDYGKRYAIQRLYADFETMLKTEKPDILHVVTPPAFREQALEQSGLLLQTGV